MKLNAVRHYHNKLIIFFIVAVSAAVFVINSLITSSSFSASSSVASTGVESVNLSAVLHSLSATFVRVDAVDPAKPVRLVLSVEAAELADFMDAYDRGFVAETVKYPDDGGILLHNPELCRGRPLDWVVYVHTSPSNRRRRELLRATWANVDLFKQLHFRVVFLLGKPPPDSDSVQACGDVFVIG